MTNPRRDDRLWQAGFLVGSALGAAVTVLGRRAERSARRGLVDWTQAEAVAVGRLRKAPGRLDAAELRRSEPAYAAAMAVVVPRLAERAGDGAARDRRSGRRRRPGRLGAGQRGQLRRPDRPARRPAPRPGRAGRRRARPGDPGHRQPLGHDPPDRLPPGVHGRPGPGPVRPRPAGRRERPRPAPVRRGEHPPDGARSWTSRSIPSGPGSPCTRRPMPSSSRRTPGSGRTSPSDSSAS